MKIFHMIAFILLIIGGLNWGLVGIGGLASSDWNVVHLILGGMPALEWLVYILVGISAVFIAVGHKKDCRACTMGSMM
jgi:hypothetical protein